LRRLRSLNLPATGAKPGKSDRAQHDRHRKTLSEEGGR
jgi:hypothetical protein